MSQCSDVSKDFTKLKAGEPRLLYKSGHIGGYIGKEVTRGGHVYNCIECTAAWGGGILYSYVDSRGGRYNYKGGSKNGDWTHNGLMTPWVKYVSAPQGKPQETPKKSNEEIADEVIAGKWGNTPERRARLEAAGYNYSTIQAIVNEKLKKYVTSGEVFYTVKSGDSFYSIAKNYPGVSAQDIMDFNGLSSSKIKPGMTIKIPKK
jgi:LysM repeat protein